jgi:diguanylate cyclase (GGDEF)-like protein
MVLLCAVLAQGLLLNTEAGNTRNLAGRNAAEQHNRMLRDALRGAEQGLRSYLVAPRQDLPDLWRGNLDKAAALTSALRELPWAAEQRLGPTLGGLAGEIAELKAAAERLKSVRDDNARTFPLFTVMRDEMAPANDAFDSAAGLAMQELSEMPDHPDAALALRGFADLRYRWARMIAAFRAYSANLAGIYTEPGEAVHSLGNDTVTYYAQIGAQLDALDALDQRGVLDIQSQEALAEMRRQAQRWHAGFIQLRTSSSAAWRADLPILNEAIVPALQRAWQHLQTLDGHIERSALRDYGTLNKIVATITHMLWLISAALLGVTVLGYMLFERNVLAPIAELVRAFKAEAGGATGLSPVNTPLRETADLIQAFASMREQVRSRQHALEHQALHDALTRLPNRALLQDRLAHAIQGAHRARTPLALVIIDLNHFKEVNDTLGHLAGDQMLEETGRRLSGLLREDDTVARLGGDEFAVLLPGAGEDDAEKLAARIVQALELPYDIDGQRIVASGSLGIALYPQHGTDVETLVRHADVAMYSAKRIRSGHAFYDLDNDPNSVQRLNLVAELRAAIEADELELHYQPQARLDDGRVTALEALLRWRHPRRGMVPPGEVVEVAERTGLIKPLTHWVLNRALRDLAGLLREGHDLSIAVNLSTVRLGEQAIEAHLAGLLAHWMVPARRLTLEITEGALMSANDRALLVRFQEMGVNLAVDDYGTGFSSLAYLKTLPITELKIDQSFVRDICDDENDAAIVRSTIELAHNLDRHVVAEGVENAQVWARLAEYGCDLAQGYHLCRPLPLPELLGWLHARAALPHTRRA